MGKPPSDDSYWIGMGILVLLIFCVGFLLGSVMKACPSDFPDPVAVVGAKAPWQRVAEKALAGNYHKLKRWQATAYRLLLEHGPAQEGKAYVTHYTPPHFERGQKTHWGWGCTEGCWASNKLPGYWYVLVQHPDTGFWEIGWVRDTGASWNDNHWKQTAREHYGVTVDLWLDRWHPSPKMSNVSWPGASYVAIAAVNAK